MANDYNWEFPYSSRRAPVFARNVVATSQPLASQAGLKMLQDGGNAVDAALAAAITLTVVEPCSNGVGSDAFAQIHDGDQLVGYSGHGRSPAAWSPKHFAQYDSMPIQGWDTVTVPGAVKTWVDLHERFGRLEFEQLFEPAIHYAESGFQVGHITAYHWQRSVDHFRTLSPFQRHFCHEGRAPHPGEVFKRPELADSLRSIADSHGRSFYEGELAQQIVNQSLSEGGLLTLEDLFNHQGSWTQPLSMQYGDIVLHELPPSGQGIASLIALGILKHIKSNLENQGTEPLLVDSPAWLHYQVEAMKIAIRASFEYVSDPHFSKAGFDFQSLLDDDLLSQIAKNIRAEASELPPIKLPTSKDTVYLAAADQDGCMVSLIQSNFMGFGSGVVIDGTGIAMQNRGAGFVLEQGHPNQVAGSKHPYHTIIPGFVTDVHGRPKAAFGVMGGHMQHQGHVQMVSRMFEYGQNPQAASDAPRWYLSPDYELFLELGFSNETLFEVATKGHSVTVDHDSVRFGGAQLIVKLEDGYCAASDHRKEGCAVGF